MARLGKGCNRQGFTLHEVMIVVVIVGILASLALLSYWRTIEFGRFRAAQDTLRAIYAGERVYWTRINTFYCTALTPGSLNWPNIFMDDPNNTSGPVQFSVNGACPGTGPAATFSATAVYNGKTLIIDQNNLALLAGTWSP
jgi:prepilin-type N-terminal cleavage/methylation domain-containing protein